MRPCTVEARASGRKVAKGGRTWKWCEDARCRGKIARLPKHLRHQLNGRLEDGEPGKQLAEWLNGLPEVQEVLKLRFGGRPISEQNLSEWKQGGYLEWLKLQESRYLVQHLAEQAEDLAPGARPNRNQSSPQSAASSQPNQTESNPIKPDQTPPPTREASPQAKANHHSTDPLHIKADHLRPGFQFISATQPTLQPAP
jgi:hypothetical protein